ncbi:MAG: EAL domain-containing protein [Gammaproteobacteria bacterium]|nr:EAL domain-containing protein [Gammaproteobacteria bacterium]MBU1414671.1 EAL domain-containing protein [Gammaproteobacteria bacterium]
MTIGWAERLPVALADEDRRPLVFAALAIASLPFLAWLPLPATFDLAHSYIGFHTAAELIAIITAVLIFNVGHYGMADRRPAANYILACAFLAVALLDLLHTLSYPGMPPFITDNTPEKTIVFWLGARYAEAVGLLAWLTWPKRWVDRPEWRTLLAAALAWVAVVALAGFVFVDAFPPMFVPGVGLTGLKIGLESGVVALLVAGAVAAARLRVAPSYRRTLVAVPLLMIASELCFTVYTRPDDAANAVGHVYKLAAFYFLYRIAVVQGLLRPVVALATAQADLAEREARLRQIVDGAPEGVIGVDGEGVIRFVNPMIETLFGHAPDAVIGHPVEVLLPKHLRDMHRLRRETYAREPQPMLLSRGLVGHRADGSEFPVEVSVQPPAVKEGLFVVFVRDISEKRRQEVELQRRADELHRRANFDELTGLPNRAAFVGMVEEATASHSSGGVVLIDLDNFRMVNDTLGHGIGDQVLGEIALRLGRLLPKDATLARLGGDEFGVLIPGVDHPGASKLANLLVTACREPVAVADHPVYLNASAGVSSWPRDCRDAGTLLRFADSAMYNAKAAGRGTYRAFAPEMDPLVRDDIRLMARLREAIEHDRLVLHYQPQIDSRSRRLVAVEALLRWHDEFLGNVSPARFVPAAEATGLMVPLGEWVLRAACRQAAAWAAAGRPLPIAVNLSAQQFRHYPLAERVETIVREAGVSPELIELEITETAVMEFPAQAIATLHVLRSRGHRTALDDFGTGHSSLAYLKMLPLDKLKLDRSFILDLPDDVQDGAIVGSIVELAATLGINVVAEGVETEGQAEFLAARRCTVHQGWLYAKAMSVDELDASHWRAVAA